MRKLSAIALGSILLAFAGANQAAAQTLPVGFGVPNTTLSPDHRYGVTVAEKAYYDSIPQTAKNQVVDTKAAKIIGTINADLGFDEANFNEVLPAHWSTDSTVLLWHVDGKWNPTALVLLNIQDGAIKWQTDLLKTAQQAVLTRTKKAKPQVYATVTKENADDGSAFPDGFTVDVFTDLKQGEPVSLPLTIHAALTSNPKGIDGATNLDALLDGVVGADGKFTVKSFRLATPDQWQAAEDSRPQE